MCLGFKRTSFTGLGYIDRESLNLPRTARSSTLSVVILRVVHASITMYPRVATSENETSVSLHAVYDAEDFLVTRCVNNSVDFYYLTKPFVDSLTNPSYRYQEPGRMSVVFTRTLSFFKTRTAPSFTLYCFEIPNTENIVYDYEKRMNSVRTRLILYLAIRNNKSRSPFTSETFLYSS